MSFASRWARRIQKFLPSSHHHNSPGRMPVWLCATLIASTGARGASAQNSVESVAAEEATAATTTAPALALRIEGEPPIPREVLAQEVSRAVGRPVSDSEGGNDGVITLSFDKDGMTGALQVRVRYEPPPAQLLRIDVLPTNPDVIAPRIAELVQSLLRQDAGVTVITPPPPPLPTREEQAASPCPTDVTTPVERPSVAKAKPGSPRTTTQGAGHAPRPLEPWRLHAGMRWGMMSSGAATGNDAAGRISDKGSLLGGSIQLTAPSTGRLRLGIEGVFESFDFESTLANGQLGSLQGLYMGISATPSLNLLKKRGFEVNLSGHLGMVQSLGIDLAGFTSSSVQTASDVGYRVGAALDINYWLNEDWAITGAFGMDQVSVTVRSLRSLEGPDGTRTTVGQDIHVWLKQPYLRLGATYRF